MANVRLVFIGTDRSETNQTELECYLNGFNEIYVCIEGGGFQYICLDKSTAIRLAKTLRTEINKMEVENG